MRHLEYQQLIQSQKLHDKYIGQLLHGIYRELKSRLSQQTEGSNSVDIFKICQQGRQLHDKEIGLVIKSGFQSLTAPQGKRPMPHRVLAP